MYTVSKRLKTTSFAFIIVGLISFAVSLFTVPKDVDEVKQFIQSQNQSLEHSHTESEHGENFEHILHQLQNRPWSALYVNAIFFLVITLGVCFFLAIQYVAQAGWSVLLYRIMEAITSFLPYVAVVIIALLVASLFHVNHMFHWMADGISDPEHPNYDALIAGKASYLNATFFLVRVVIYFVGWFWMTGKLRAYSLLEDSTGGYVYHGKNVKTAAIFIVFFAITSSMASWDLVMSLDAHWFSTLFGWYVLAGMIVTGVTTIALITIYLKSLGHLKEVNGSHIHDLGKFMFGFSIFWAYLWFSQFMLIWYANLPEEVTYYMARFEDYKVPFLTMVALNFLCPLIILMNSDFKRIPWFISFTGILILMGHWLDIFVMIMPATVGSFWYIGFVEVGLFLAFLGVFILVVMGSLSKMPSLTPKSNPFLEESKRFHL